MQSMLLVHKLSGYNLQSITSVMENATCAEPSGPLYLTTHLLLTNA